VKEEKPKEEIKEKPKEVKKKEEVKQEEPVEEKPEEAPVEEPGEAVEPDVKPEEVVEPDIKPEEDVETDIEPKPEDDVSEETEVEEKPDVEPESEEETQVEEEPEEEMEPEEEVQVEEEKPEIEPQKPEPPVETKKTIPFKDLGVAPDSEPWDGPGEKAKAEVSDLKLMCAWYDSEKPDVKGSYKLPHHKATGHKCVWRGTAAAMAALLGARDGVQIPASDKKGVYNHLRKHYKQFDKEAPDFKMVEGQILAGLDDEIHALMLEREDRYMVRLIKKVLKRQNKVKKVKIEEIRMKYTPKQIKAALEVLDLALSQISVSSQKGGEKKG